MRYIVIKTKTEFSFVDAQNKEDAVHNAETFQEYFNGVAQIQALELKEE